MKSLVYRIIYRTYMQPVLDHKCENAAKIGLAVLEISWNKHRKTKILKLFFLVLVMCEKLI